MPVDRAGPRPINPQPAAAEGYRSLPGAVAHQTWFVESSLRVQPLRWLALGLEARKDVIAAEGTAQAYLYF